FARLDLDLAARTLFQNVYFKRARFTRRQQRRLFTDARRDLDLELVVTATTEGQQHNSLVETKIKCFVLLVLFVKGQLTLRVAIEAARIEFRSDAQSIRAHEVSQEPRVHFETRALQIDLEVCARRP